MRASSAFIGFGSYERQNKKVDIQQLTLKNTNTEGVHGKGRLNIIKQGYRRSGPKTSSSRDKSLHTLKTTDWKGPRIQAHAR